jgi:hypothetical protein
MRTQFNDAKLTKYVCIRKINVLQLMKTFKTHIKKGDTNYRCAFLIGIKVVNVCQYCKIPYLFQIFFTNKSSICMVFYNFIDPINIILKHQISCPHGNEFNKVMEGFMCYVNYFQFKVQLMAHELP